MNNYVFLLLTIKSRRLFRIRKPSWIVRSTMCNWLKIESTSSILISPDSRIARALLWSFHIKMYSTIGRVVGYCLCIRNRKTLAITSRPSILFICVNQIRSLDPYNKVENVIIWSFNSIIAKSLCIKRHMIGYNGKELHLTLELAPYSIPKRIRYRFVF